MEIIGTKFELYNDLLAILRKMFLDTGRTSFCIIRFDILMAMHELDIREVSYKLINI